MCVCFFCGPIDFWSPCSYEKVSIDVWRRLPRAAKARGHFSFRAMWGWDRESLTPRFISEGGKSEPDRAGRSSTSRRIDLPVLHVRDDHSTHYLSHTPVLHSAPLFVRRKSIFAKDGLWRSFS